MARGPGAVQAECADACCSLRSKLADVPDSLSSFFDLRKSNLR